MQVHFHCMTDIIYYEHSRKISVALRPEQLDRIFKYRRIYSGDYISVNT